MRSAGGERGIADWLPQGVERRSDGFTLAWICGVALAIRLYLSLTSYCISGDGVAYLAMAQDFAAGLPRQALDHVFSPLYPLLIAAAHVAIPDWEMAGNLVSAMMGTAAVATIFGMTRAAMGRRDLAIGAAALTAIHPDMAAYSASVRTEAGYIMLMTAAVWSLIAALDRRRLPLVVSAGAIGGLAYLFRTEAIAFLPFAAIFMVLGAPLWRRWSLGWAIVAAITFCGSFLLIASPYLVYLRISSGHWILSREFTAAMMYGMGEVAPNSRHWQALGYSTHVSALTPIFADPMRYLRKVGDDLLGTLIGFVRAMGPAPVILLPIGLWGRGRAIAANFAEAMLTLLTLAYAGGFAISYTGARFMLHVIPYVFGWTIAGLAAASNALERMMDQAAKFPLPHGALAAAVALTMLPQTLWPIGYDQRGFRHAGEEIATRAAGRPIAVVARDGRVAFYAHARFILLGDPGQGGLCRWLEARPEAGYLLLGDRDVHRFRAPAATPCLAPVRRYGRYGKGYFELFVINRSK
jgi:hypothetical protein